MLLLWGFTVSGFPETLSNSLCLFHTLSLLGFNQINFDRESKIIEIKNSDELSGQIERTLENVSDVIITDSTEKKWTK